MLNRTLGRSGMEVSAMGLGCYAIGGQFRVESGQQWGWTGVEDEESIRAIRQAIDAGVNFIDTAQAYGAGHSERVVGRAIKGRRDQVLLATKFGKSIDERGRQILGSSIQPKHLRQSLEDSLRRFGTETIDLFQWHEAEGSLDELPALLDLLDTFVEEGKIRFYGWSTDDPDRAAQMALRSNCVAVQHRVNIFEPPENVSRMLAVCEAQNLGSVNRTPLLMGILSGKFSGGSAFEEGDVRNSLGIDFTSERWEPRLRQLEDLREVLTSDGRTLVQGAIAWIWARSPRFVPIPGFKSVAQVTENIGAMKFGPLSEDQFQQVESVMGRA